MGLNSTFLKLKSLVVDEQNLFKRTIFKLFPSMRSIIIYTASSDGRSMNKMDMVALFTKLLEYSRETSDLKEVRVMGVKDGYDRTNWLNNELNKLGKAFPKKDRK